MAKMTKIEEKKHETALHLSILKQMVTLSTSGFGVVAALAWNNVIKEFVDSYITPYLPKGSSIVSLVIYASVVTVVAVLVTYQLGKLIQRIEKLNEFMENRFKYIPEEET